MIRWFGFALLVFTVHPLMSSSLVVSIWEIQCPLVCCNGGFPLFPFEKIVMIFLIVKARLCFYWLALLVKSQLLGIVR